MTVQDLTAAAEMAEGPYYGHGGELRSNIAEDRPGEAMHLQIDVLNMHDASPVEGARVDIWHSDATGHYSGYEFDPDQAPQSVVTQMPSNNETFLRGAQNTDADGRASFETIFPGWYAGRAPHIHIKVFMGENCVLTSQLFLPEDAANRVYKKRKDYKRVVEQDTSNRTDTVIALTPDPVDGCWVNITEGDNGLQAHATLAIDPDDRSIPMEPPADFKPPLGGIEHQQSVR